MHEQSQGQRLHSSPTSNICNVYVTVRVAAEMFDFKVFAPVISLLVYLDTSPCMATGLRVLRGESSGVIGALLRSSKGSHSVARGLHIRQLSCQAGSYACSDGKFPHHRHIS